MTANDRIQAWRTLWRFASDALARRAAPAVARDFGPLAMRCAATPPRAAERLAATGLDLPVHRWWNRITADLPPPLRDAVARLGPDLAWMQNPNYCRRPVARFLGRYGYAPLVGPTDRGVRPPMADAAFAAGLLMLGPSTLYARHHHPAEEIYLPLAGTALWQRGDAPWRPVAPGRPIHHPPDLPHATRTGGAPLLALYFWRGEIATRARLGGR